jgi:hypothetical protein
MTIPIQACYEITSDKTKEREMSAILKFWDEHYFLELSFGLVITSKYSGVEHFGNRQIIFAAFEDIFNRGFDEYISSISGME